MGSVNSDRRATQIGVTQMDVEKLMQTKLTGVVGTQRCVITESGTNGNGVQFRGTMEIDCGDATVGDVFRRAVSNVVIAAAPPIRKRIMEYRSKKTISIKFPKPGSRERATAITTQSDVETFLGNVDDDTLAAIVATVTERRNA
jgi:hypothetical protein